MKAARKRKMKRVVGALMVAGTTVLCSTGTALAATRSVTSTVNVRTQNANGSWSAYRVGAKRTSAEGQRLSFNFPENTIPEYTGGRASLQLTALANGTYNVSVPNKAAKSTMGVVNVQVQQEDGRSFKTYPQAVVETVPVGLTERVVIAQGDSVYQDTSAIVRSGSTTTVRLMRRQVQTTHTIMARYQNPDGSYAAPVEVKRLTGVEGQQGSFALPATDTFQAANVKFTFRGNGQSTVNVARKSYPLSMRASTGISKVTGKGSFRVGQKVSVSATPASGYAFSRWTATAGVIANPAAATTTFTMPAKAATLTATAAPAASRFSVSATAGFTSITPTSGTAKAGEKVTITAKLASGYRIGSCKVTTKSGKNVPIDNLTVVQYEGAPCPIRFTAPAEDVIVSLSAVKTADSSTSRITVSKSAGFTSITPASATVKAGQQVSITMRLATGYKFGGCSVNVGGSSERVTPSYRVSGNVVTMTFKAPAATRAGQVSSVNVIPRAVKA